MSVVPPSETDVSLTEVSQLSVPGSDSNTVSQTVSIMTTKPTSASQAKLDENNHRTLELTTTNFSTDLVTPVQKVPITSPVAVGDVSARDQNISELLIRSNFRLEVTLD